MSARMAGQQDVFRLYALELHPSESSLESDEPEFQQLLASRKADNHAIAMPEINYEFFDRPRIKKSSFEDGHEGTVLYRALMKSGAVS
jgi:hypothetical protein